MKKRVISLCMALLMMVSLLPSAAFAADVVAITVGNATVEAGQSVTVDVSISGASSAAFAAVYLDFTYDNALTLTNAVLSDAATQAGFQIASRTGGNIQIDGDTSSGTSLEDGTLLTLTFDISENASGEYTIAVGYASNNANNVYDYQYNNVACAFTAGTITVGASGGEGDGYTATIANGTAAQTIRVGDTITVNIGANKAHSASQMTVTYDSTLVSFESATGCTVNAETAGTLKLASYGAEKATADYYVLTFIAIADGSAAFTITDAKFGTGTSAETASLEDATVPAALNVTIAKKQYSVILNQYDGVEIFAGADVAVDGETYTFKPETATGAHYDYTLTVVTMNGSDVMTSVTGNAANGWSIANVTGPLVISGTRTGKPQTVTIDTVFGNETTTQNKTAYYATPYTFTVPADETVDGVINSYALSSVKIGGVEYTGYSAAEGTKTYTIPGNAITGAIEINITKSNKFTVAISGEGAGQVSADPVQVAPGGSVTLTLSPETGYDYVVKVNGNAVTLSNNQYTINNVQSTADVTVTVEKTLITTYVSAVNYLQVDGSRFWLVKIAPTDPTDTDTSAQIARHTYTYNDTNMYWSSVYNAYVTLVVAETAPTLTAGDFNIVQVDNIPTITYDMNVNMSTDSVVDPADAQLVWNMYSVTYSDFTTDVTLEKFLKADVNGDSKVDVNDAAAIIRSSHVLNLSETTN